KRFPPPGGSRGMPEMSSRASALEPVTDDRPGMERGDGRVVPILGVPLTPCSFDEGVARIRDMVVSDRPHHVVLANTHTLNLTWSEPSSRRILCAADLVLRDGAGVELAMRLAGADPRHNFVGTDFVPALLRHLGLAEIRVFLFGAEPGVTERAARELETRAT